MKIETLRESGRKEQNMSHYSGSARKDTAPTVIPDSLVPK